MKTDLDMRRGVNLGKLKYSTEKEGEKKKGRIGSKMKVPRDKL